MKREPTQTKAFLVPGWSDWEVRSEHGLDEGEPTVRALGISEFASLPVSVVSESENESDLRSSIAFKLEENGIEVSAIDDREWSYWPLSQEIQPNSSEDEVSETLSVFGSAALLPNRVLPDSAETLLEEVDAEEFVISPCLRSLHPDGVTVWQELGQTVASWSSGGILIHSQPLSVPLLHPRFASELHALETYLKGVGAIPNADCELRILAPTSEVETIRNNIKPLGNRRFEIIEEGWNLKEEGDWKPLWPMTATEGKAQIKRKKRLLFFAKILLGCWILGLIAMFIDLHLKRKKAAESEEATAKKAPMVELIRQARSDWMEVENAVDPALYPLQILRSCTSVLPPEGVRLSDFNYDDEGILIQGDASDIDLALRFKEALINHPDLSHLEWRFNPPQILPDNQARFRAEVSWKTEDET